MVLGFKNHLDKPPAAQPGSAEQEYQQALERVARDVGLEPLELQKRLRETADTMEPTSQCLTLGELEAFPEIPANRYPHVNECHFCQGLLRSMAATPLEIRRFVEDAVLPPTKSLRRWKAPWVPCFAGGFAAVLALVFFVQFIHPMASLKLDSDIRRWYEEEYKRVEAATLREPRDPELFLRKTEILVLLHRQKEARRALEKAKVTPSENSAETQRYEKLIQAGEATHFLTSFKNRP